MLRCFAATLVAATLLAPEAGAVKAQIRVGGPSAPGEPMVAIVGSDSNLAGKRYVVRQVGGKVVNRGKLIKAPGKPAPWKHAYAANLGELRPGSYRVEVGRLGSRPWTVSETGAGPALETMLQFFVSNRDGNEPSSTHGPAHLSDAVVHPSAAVAPGQTLDMTGGWMDAGDMTHFTQTTAFSTRASAGRRAARPGTRRGAQRRGRRRYSLAGQGPSGAGRLRRPGRRRARSRDRVSRSRRRCRAQRGGDRSPQRLHAAPQPDRRRPRGQDGDSIGDGLPAHRRRGFADSRARLVRRRRVGLRPGAGR